MSEDFNKYAKEMCEELAIYSKHALSYTPLAQISAKVLDVMATVPRHIFTPWFPMQQAYMNTPMGIGYGQTISQPYIVAVMTSLLDPMPNHKILEIGTGSGYQTAILAKLVGNIYSIETIAPLAEQAQLHFAELGLTNIQCKISNGSNGWAEFAPYDGIIVTAASTSIPPALLEQLKPNGKIVIPIEYAPGHQELILAVKHTDSTITQESILPVRFVPFQNQTNES